MLVWGWGPTRELTLLFWRYNYCWKMWYGYGGPRDAQRPGVQVTSSDGCCGKTRAVKAIYRNGIAVFSSKV